jgi:His/Glu/Gln/Arg/opine family amino acid ABC transporter permease subunit
MVGGMILDFGFWILDRRRLRGLLPLFILLYLCSSAGAQDALERVRARGEIVIATDPTYPPFEQREAGRLQGLDIDLGNEIGRELGVRVQWLPLEWSGVMGALESRKADLVMSGVTITDERKKGYFFSRPYFLSGQAIARRRGDTRIRGRKDLIDKIIAVQEGTTGQFAVEKLGVPGDRILKFDQLADGLLDVRNGKADAAVADLPTLKALFRQGYPELELAGDTLTRESLAVVVRRGEASLTAEINRALNALMVDGRYARIYEKWIGEPATPTLVADLERVRAEGTPIVKSGSEETRTSSLSIRWPLLRQALPFLLAGARITLWVTLLTLLIGVPAGLLVALARLSRFRLLKLAATVYVEVVRGTPLLMQIYVIYFVLPALDLNLPNMVAAVTALSINSAAYVSEIFRAGIESIEAGQMEAARALGMGYRAAMRWVILPQTIRRVLPPLTNEAVALLKDSSLISVVAIAELMRQGKEFATNTGEPTTIYLGVALLYLAMTLPLTWLTRRLEAKWQPVSRPLVRKAGIQEQSA